MTSAIEKELRRRLELEKMLTDISDTAIAPHSLSGFQDECLAIMGQTLGVHRTYILEYRPVTATMDYRHEWVAEGIQPKADMLQGIPVENYAWWHGMMMANRIIRYSSVDQVPAKAERDLLAERQIKSILAVPLFVHQAYYGFIGFDECGEERRWYDEDVNILLAITRIMTGLIERIRSEQALVREQRQLLSIFDSVDQYIYVSDPKTYEILFVNKAAQNNSSKELVGKTCYRVFQGKRTPCEFCTNEIILKKKYMPHKWEYHHPVLGRDYILFDRIIKWPDGRDVKFEIAVDISERKQTEKALAESEEKYRQLFEMESDAILLVDDETGRILEVNSACEQLYGYPRERLLHMKLGALAAEAEVDRPQGTETIPVDGVCYHRKKDGTIVPVEIKDRHFQFKGRDVHVAAVRDVSGRIAAEKDRHILENQLRQAQKMESIGTLAGGIAHDFNNILSAIIGYTELAKLSMPPDNRAQSNLESVLDASQRAKNLVAQILTFSRPTAPEFGPVQMGTVLREAVKMMRVMLPAAIRIQLEIETKCRVLADPGQIHQVIMNLCTNAYQAMREEGGSLTLALCDLAWSDICDAGIHELNPGDYLRLTVTDTGTGMDQATLGRIYDPYFSTKRKGEGTGLGLSMAYGIITAHKGAIAVESEVGRGTRFSIYLPKYERNILVKTPSGHTSVPTGNERILFVDDERDLVDLAEAMLSHIGYRITASYDSLEALSLFKQKPSQFDLVITDLNMPNMIGFRLAKEISRIRADIPIILSTGFNDDIDEGDLAAAGICSVAQKPMLLADTARLIRQVLDNPCAVRL